MNRRRTRKERTKRARCGQMAPIGVLPDDVLLAIFDFYVFRIRQRKKDIEAWQSLVHVCRRWRCVVFGSPRRLNLRLVCTPRTPARESLDVWPALPLIVEGTISSKSVDNIVVALGHSDRVCQIDLRITRRSQWDKILAAMRAPFPALTDLLFQCDSEPASRIPDTFLGGYAPLLRRLEMECIPFPGLPNIFSSARHLVHLDLSDSPHSGYIPAEWLVNCLSVLTSLDTLSLSFEFVFSRSRRRPPPITRSIFPNLTSFCFKGERKFLDDLVARIDAPRLDYLDINLLQPIFDTPHLVQFIGRIPRFEEPNEARVTLGPYTAVQLLWASYDCRVGISCEESYQQLSSIAWVCTMCLPPLPTVVNLRIEAITEDLYSELDWRDDVEDNQCLELLRPFTAVKNLYLPEEFQSDMASALQELVGGRTTEVLPSLQNIFLERFEPSGPFQEAIGQFVAARQLSGRPIAVLPL